MDGIKSNSMAQLATKPLKPLKDSNSRVSSPAAAHHQIDH